MERFGLPLLARTAVVQRNPDGLGSHTQARAVLRALEVDKRTITEGATLAAVALVIGLAFRSVVAPLITLVAAVISYLIADRMIGAFAEIVGFAAPAQLRPIVISLVGRASGWPGRRLRIGS